MQRNNLLLLLLMLVLSSFAVYSFEYEYELTITSNSSHFTIEDEFDNEYTFHRNASIINIDRDFDLEIDNESCGYGYGRPTSVVCGDVQCSNIPACPPIPAFPVQPACPKAPDVVIPENDEGALKECIASIDKQLNPPPEVKSSYSSGDIDWASYWWLALIGIAIVIYIWKKDMIDGYIYPKKNRHHPVTTKKVKHIEPQIDIPEAPDIKGMQYEDDMKELKRHDVMLKNRKQPSATAAPLDLKETLVDNDNEDIKELQEEVNAKKLKRLQSQADALKKQIANKREQTGKSGNKPEKPSSEPEEEEYEIAEIDEQELLRKQNLAKNLREHKIGEYFASAFMGEDKPESD